VSSGAVRPVCSCISSIAYGSALGQQHGQLCTAAPICAPFGSHRPNGNIACHASPCPLVSVHMPGGKPLVPLLLPLLLLSLLLLKWVLPVLPLLLLLLLLVVLLMLPWLLVVGRLLALVLARVLWLL